MTRLLATLLIAATVSVGLAGCGRFGQGDRSSDVPVPAVSSPAAGTDQDLLAELDAVDDALTQIEEEGAAGDEAAQTDDAP